MFDNGYAKYYDLFNSDKPYKKEIEFVYKWAGRPKSILDIGCGTGSYWKFYPKETEIVGVEKSSAMQESSFGPRYLRGHEHILCADICKIKLGGEYDCATALFDVLNYIPNHGWWKNIPIKKGGHFIFDIWDAAKVKAEGFEPTLKTVRGISRIIIPEPHSNFVDLNITVFDREIISYELHTMYIHTHKKIENACGKEFEIVEVKPTKRWQTWYRLKKK